MNILTRMKTKYMIKKVLREWEANGEILNGWHVSWNKHENSFKINVEPTEKMKDASKLAAGQF